MRKRSSDVDASAISAAVRAALNDLCVEVDLGPDGATMLPAVPEAPAPAPVVVLDVDALASAVIAQLVDARRARGRTTWRT